MSQEAMMREALQKFAAGERLADEELDGLLVFFKQTTAVLDELTRYFDSGYSFAHENARRNLEHLKVFERSRDDERKRNIKYG